MQGNYNLNLLKQMIKTEAKIKAMLFAFLFDITSITVHFKILNILVFRKNFK